MPSRRPAYSYFIIPMIAFVLAVFAAGIISGPVTSFLVANLALLEISLSFDNAVVNAHVLQNWDAKWRQRFLGLGIIVAVFGMRLVFPILIVSAAAHIPVLGAIDLALNHADLYAAKLTSVHAEVSAFGGAFLAMLGLGYFFDAEKDNHWIGPIESLLAKCGQVEAIQAALTVLALISAFLFMPEAARLSFLTAGLIGIVTYVATRAIATITSGGDVENKIIPAGIGGFLYLEILDASFSFDGVLGAFALTTNIIWIAVGLGVGALAVRELTMLAVDRKALTVFPYLENGAFWAILALAGMMILSPVHDLPDMVKGLTGAVLILAALITSLPSFLSSLKDAQNAPVAPLPAE
jgi:hypothetical protein